MMINELSDKALTQRQQAVLKYGIYAFNDHGEESLNARNVKSLAESVV